MNTENVNIAGSVQTHLPDFESVAFRERYVAERADGLFETRLLIKGLRCAGCVHTSESLLRKIPGVVEAEVNYSNHHARFVWNPKQASLKPALELLQESGFEGLPQALVDFDQPQQKEETEKLEKGTLIREEKKGSKGQQRKDLKVEAKESGGGGRVEGGVG